MFSKFAMCPSFSSKAFCFLSSARMSEKCSLKPSHDALNSCFQAYAHVNISFKAPQSNTERTVILSSPVNQTKGGIDKPDLLKNPIARLWNLRIPPKTSTSTFRALGLSPKSCAYFPN